jgi:NTF2-related export protein 1/2
VEAYYDILSNARTSIVNYYQAKETAPDGATLPNIVWNGNQIPGAEAFQKMFVDEMPYTFYETQSIDCHVLNDQFYPPSAGVRINNDKNLSLLVVVSGYLRLEDRKEGPMREFSETLILVPNKDKASGRTNAASSKRNWLIQTQIFRFVVMHESTAGLASMELE